MKSCVVAILGLLLSCGANAFVAPNRCRTNKPRAVEPLEASKTHHVFDSLDKAAKNAAKVSAAVFLAGILTVSPAIAAGDGGASVGANAKITTGGASTLQSGRTIAITRGVNLDNSDFSKQNLKGVAFQQSMLLVLVVYRPSDKEHTGTHPMFRFDDRYCA